ncbi:pentapeptide repeat-containing protein [Moorena producens JHB]|uniref:Pentapeptide repeat-containing protein n=1 Tax=Moorena producens (strain JHB) TaxID=1454205 RepID=A0A9Q9STR5_MOOP1|nr:pentapeptide repeat-containing protein [Moorena producens JHB]
MAKRPRASQQSGTKSIAFNQTTFNQTTFNQTTFNQTTFNQTTFNQTTFNQTTFNQTTFKMSKIRNRPNSVRAECGVRSERKHLSPLFPLYVTVYFFSAISKPIEKF